jgi:ppGpp synthetase/RelA/SpoT-type nucleotidyltranferase
LQDTYGIRILTAAETDCYTVLDNVRRIIKHNQTKDYIENPKKKTSRDGSDYEYRAIHEIGIAHEKVIELQIRTTDMEKSLGSRFNPLNHKLREKRKNEQRDSIPRWVALNNVVRQIFDPPKED